jgi:hypothetical protein
MENFVGLLYNSGTTQEGLAYKNGFGSTYQVSGGNPGDINAGITITGLTDTISETDGFIFWMKFECTKLSNLTLGDWRTCFFMSKPVPIFTYSPSSFTVNMDYDNQIQFGFGNAIPQYVTQYIKLNNTSTIIETGLTYNILIYKERSKNFTNASAFTTYVNNYKYVYPAFSTYSYPNFAIDLPQIFCDGSSNSSNSRFNMRLYNMGMSRTTMTPAEFDLFAQKMHVYDNYWHLFEGETDTPNINKSQLIFYAPLYSKQGDKTELYPKSDTKFGITFANTNTLTLGKNNRWKKPYPPYEPYI